MLGARGIEGVRVLMGLLSLSDKHSRRVIEQACQIAHSHGAYHLRSVRQLIEHQSSTATAQTKPLEQQTFDFIQQHPIIRDLGDYERFVRQAITGQQFLPATEAKASGLESMP
jgi:hypothetical protein